LPDLKDQLQRTLGSNYTLERELGGGGMSRVFVAEELSLERKVVVKVLPPELAATVNVERFRREIQLAAKLQHPHIVPVLAAGISEGLPYYTMPFIEGVSLRARLARSGELPVQEAAKILRDVLSALSYAHAHGVVHRDIKPDNVLLTDHHAVVVDFGVAKALSASTNPGSSLTSLGVALGTPAYMSPEQAAADPNADQRTDIYSVGALAYEMLTGHQVFSARSPQAMLAAHATEKPEPIDKRRPSVPKALSSLVMRALEKHAADRPQSAEEMLADLEAAVTPSGATPPTGFIPARGRRGWRNPLVISGAVVVAALLILFLGRGRIGPGLGGPRGAAGSDGSINTIAVLPFANIGGNRQDEYFSDGMTEELARALSLMPNIQVASRTSSYAFKGKSVTAQDIGRTLHVGGVVEGTVRRAGNRLRVTAQLTNASTGLVMWTNGFERPASNVFEVQDELTKAIVAALTPKLSGDTAALVAAESRGTADPLAYDLYLRGRFEWNKRTGKDIKEGIADFERAVARDPKFARAYAALASSYAVLPQYAADEFPLEKSLAAVRSNVEKALAIDSTLAEPHAALGLALEQTWRWAESEREFRKAIALDPSYATAHHWYAFLLNDLGRQDDALSEARIARKLDPLSLIIASNLCYRETQLGHFDLAATPCKESSAVHVGQNAFNYMVRGKYDSAAVEWRRAGDLLSFPGMLAYSLARGGHRSEAEAILKELEKKGGKDPLSVAIAYFGLGESDKAFAFLERAVDLNQATLKTLLAPLSSVILVPYRGDPRLQRIVDRMGLTQYAKEAWSKK
jgi:serine/threonine-protein kinase